MNKYRVTYYYLATGMEGEADERDYGIVEAPNADTAKELILEREPAYLRTWVRGCLCAEEVKTRHPKIYTSQTYIVVTTGEEGWCIKHGDDTVCDVYMGGEVAMRIAALLNGHKL